MEPHWRLCRKPTGPSVTHDPPRGRPRDGVIPTIQQSCQSGTIITEVRVRRSRPYRIRVPALRIAAVGNKITAIWPIFDGRWWRRGPSQLTSEQRRLPEMTSSDPHREIRKPWTPLRRWTPRSPSASIVHTSYMRQTSATRYTSASLSTMRRRTRSPRCETGWPVGSRFVCRAPHIQSPGQGTVAVVPESNEIQKS